MTNLTRSQFLSSTSFSFNISFTLTSKYRKFSSKNDINKKISICNIKPVNHHINLNQPLIQSQLLEDNRGKAGIYMWTNLKNGNIYIGSSVNLSPRLLKYLNENALRKNKMLISLAILKHGIENFSLDILEYCATKDVIQREQYYLDTYKPIYNILKIAGSSLGYVHNETSLAKMCLRIASEATLNKMKQRKQSEQTKEKIRKAIGIPVKVLNIDKEEITIYASKKEAGLHLNTNDTTIGLFDKYLITEVG
jgi:GIY-YIG catalytic domain-containing protein/NUMOD1 domain-containing protein